MNNTLFSILQVFIIGVLFGGWILFVIYNDGLPQTIFISLAVMISILIISHLKNEGKN